jgi:hypothetical protein
MSKTFCKKVEGTKLFPCRFFPSIFHFNRVFGRFSERRAQKAIKMFFQNQTKKPQKVKRQKALKKSRQAASAASLFFPPFLAPALRPRGVQEKKKKGGVPTYLPFFEIF